MENIPDPRASQHQCHPELEQHTGPHGCAWGMAVGAHSIRGGRNPAEAMSLCFVGVPCGVVCHAMVPRGVPWNCTVLWCPMDWCGVLWNGVVSQWRGDTLWCPIVP